MEAGLARITLVQARAIDAFVTTGNRMFRRPGPGRAPSGIGRPAELCYWLGAPLLARRYLGGSSIA